MDVKIIRRARRSAGITQRELAAQAGLDASTVATYEVGRGRPSRRAASQLLRGLIKLIRKRQEQITGVLPELEHAISNEFPNISGGPGTPREPVSDRAGVMEPVAVEGRDSESNGASLLSG